MNYLIIGEQIQKYRKEAKLTQKELGEALGVSSSAVSQWESGGTPDISLLPAIADRLGITINTLFGREDVTQENIKEVLPRYVASMPESKRLKEIGRLVWEVMGECASLNMLADSFSCKCNVYCALDDGIMLGTNSEDISYISVFPEPEKGYLAFFFPNDEYRRLFLTLSKPNALELLQFLCQKPLKYFTTDVIAKKLGIGIEETQTLLSEFAQFQFVQESELETENGDTKVYITNNLIAFLPFLYNARLMIDHQDGSFNLISERRKKSLLRKPDETKKGED